LFIDFITVVVSCYLCESFANQVLQLMAVCSTPY